MVGRRRLSHRDCMRLAIPAHRAWHGGASDLRSQSTIIFSSGCNSWSSLYRPHRLQRVLNQKLSIHFCGRFCDSYNIALTSSPALLGVEIAVYAAAAILFLTVERPFLQLRKRLAPRKYGMNR